MAKLTTADAMRQLGISRTALALAARAVIAAAIGLYNTLDEVTVPAAWFPVPAIDQELILKVTLTPLAIHVVRQGGAVVLNRRV